VIGPVSMAFSEFIGSAESTYADEVLKFAALSQGRQDREAGPRQDLSAQDGTQNQDDYLAAFFMKVGIGAGLLG
jgi:hypothetical protein